MVLAALQGRKGKPDDALMQVHLPVHWPLTIFRFMCLYPWKNFWRLQQ
jgi:hypothetical protein